MTEGSDKRDLLGRRQALILTAATAVGGAIASSATAATKGKTPAPAAKAMAPTKTERAFQELMHVYGRARPEFVHIREGAPTLPTRFAADEAVTAVFAASGVVAADIWTLRTGQGQRLDIDMREAGASLTAFRFMKFDDPKLQAERDAWRKAAQAPNRSLLGFYRTQDRRHVLLHPSFAPAQIGKALGCAPERDAVTAACLSKTADEIENAVSAERGCGVKVRTPEEWDASEQGRIIAALGPVEVIKIADGPPTPLPPGVAPLSGVRVLDLTRVLAGPTCGRDLAGWGADVLYVSSPELPNTDTIYAETSTGKMATFLDLEKGGDRDKLRDLLRTADVFSQGYRTGAFDKFGFSVHELAALRPGIIYTSINCYGHEGPWRQRAGWEQLAQAATGVAHVQGKPGEPELISGAFHDYATGHLAALGVLIALQRRAHYGGSYLVRASLCQTATWLRGLGLEGPERLKRITPMTEAEAEPLIVHSPSAFGGVGGMTHLRSPVRLSLTSALWRRPAMPLGGGPAEWPKT